MTDTAKFPNPILAKPFGSPPFSFADAVELRDWAMAEGSFWTEILGKISQHSPFQKDQVRPAVNALQQAAQHANAYLNSTAKDQRQAEIALIVQALAEYANRYLISSDSQAAVSIQRLSGENPTAAWLELVSSGPSPGLWIPKPDGFVALLIASEVLRNKRLDARSALKAIERSSAKLEAKLRGEADGLFEKLTAANVHAKRRIRRWSQVARRLADTQNDLRADHDRQMKEMRTAFSTEMRLPKRCGGKSAS